MLTKTAIKTLNNVADNVTKYNTDKITYISLMNDKKTNFTNNETPTSNTEL